MSRFTFACGGLGKRVDHFRHPAHSRRFQSRGGIGNSGTFLPARGCLGPPGRKCVKDRAALRRRSRASVALVTRVGLVPQHERPGRAGCVGLGPGRELAMRRLEPPAASLGRGGRGGAAARCDSGGGRAPGGLGAAVAGPVLGAALPRPGQPGGGHGPRSAPLPARPRALRRRPPRAGLRLAGAEPAWAAGGPGPHRALPTRRLRGFAGRRRETASPAARGEARGPVAGRGEWALPELSQLGRGPAEAPVCQAGVLQRLMCSADPY